MTERPPGFWSRLWDWAAFYSDPAHPLAMLPIIYAIPAIVHAIRQDPVPWELLSPNIAVAPRPAGGPP